MEQQQINTGAEELHEKEVEDNPVVISIQTGLDGYRLRNFYLTNSFQGFTWMMFHFSVMYFFTFLLHNIALVGIFLGFANLIAFFLDIPLGTIQRYISTKRMFIIGVISQLIAVGIFFGFIFKIFTFIHVASGMITPDSLKTGTDWFFGSALNWIGVIIASVCYGLTKEINDVSTYGYILSRANPSDYGVILSQNNITFGIGAVTGLILSGIVLGTNNMVALVILIIILISLLLFTIRFFDNSDDSFTLQDIQDFKVSIQRFNIENVKEYVVETVRKADLEKIVQGAKYLIMKPKQKINEKIPWKDMVTSTKKEFGIIWNIISHKPLYMNLVWTVSLVLIFGFWDTFASSFLLGFLDDIKHGWSYILLAIIGVPGILLQAPASKLGQKIGAKTVGIIGLSLSGFSLILMGIIAATHVQNPLIVIVVALINSLGFAFGMSTGQNGFLDIYNRVYAKHENLMEIDANASSGPIKIVQNFANVIGLIFGGFLVDLGFSLFFFIFGGIVIGVLTWTILKKEEIIL